MDFLHSVAHLLTSGGDAKEIVSRVKERVAQLNEKHMIPGGLQIVPYYDRSQLVDAAIHTVTEVLGEGILLVVVILFLFLGDLRSSFIVSATLILTPLLTFFVMNQIDLSANLMSLGGLAIAIGLMVDTLRAVFESRAPGILNSVAASTARTRYQLIAELARHPLFEGARRYRESDLAAYDPPLLRDFLVRQQVLRRSEAPWGSTSSDPA